MPNPRLYRTTGIVLRRRDFDEADRLLTVLTREHGKVTLLAKGARKIGSRKAPHVDLFKQVELLVHQGRNFGIISQAETVRSFEAMREHLEHLAVAHYVAELADAFVGEGDEAAGVYDLVLETLQWLDSGGDPRLAQRYFELHLCDLAGYRPQLYRCLGCEDWIEPGANVFDVAAGGFYCPKCSGRTPAGRVLSIGAQKVLRFLQRSPAADCKRLQDPLQEEVEALLSVYLRQILDRSPKSRRFIEAVRALPAQV
jgi:DNA repair protein RecO (recombination protein O)